MFSTPDLYDEKDINQVQRQRGATAAWGRGQQRGGWGVFWGIGPSR